jgi:hypothetical protein
MVLVVYHPYAGFLFGFLSVHRIVGDESAVDFRLFLPDRVIETAVNDRSLGNGPGLKDNSFPHQFPVVVGCLSGQYNRKEPNQNQNDFFHFDRPRLIFISTAVPGSKFHGEQREPVKSVLTL